MIRILPKGSPLVPAVLKVLDGQDRDWSHNLVIFPGRRPAHFLRKALVDSVGGSCIGPVVWAVQDWIDALAREALQLAGRWLEPMDACAVLFEVHQELPHRYGADRFDRVERFLPLGFRLLDTLETLYLGDVTPEQLRRVLPEEPLADYYARFYAQLEAKAYWTRARRIRTVAEQMESIDLSRYDRIVLAGLYAFSAAEARLFRQVLAQPQAIGLFLDGPGLSAQLQRLGVDAIPERAKPATDPVVQVYRAPDRHGQVLMLAEKLQQQRGQQGPLDVNTVVVLPAADALFPVLYHALAALPEDESYNVSLGYPLDRAPVVSFLRLLGTLATTRTPDGSYATAAYLRFLLHPYTKNLRLGRHADVTRILMHTLEEALMPQGAGTLRLEALEQNAEIFQQAAARVASLDESVTPTALQDHLRTIHDRTIRRLMQATSLSDWAERAIQVIDYVAHHSTAPQHPYFRPFADCLVELLETLAHSLLGAVRFDNLGDYWRVFESALQRQRVPLAGTPLQGLQILGLLETRGLQFDTVYVLDVNEEVLPEAPDPDPFLPDTVRMQLGLETRSDAYQLTRYYFENLVQGAREVHLFYTEHPRQGERSRFVEQMLWQWQQQHGTLEEEPWVQSIGYHLDLSCTSPEPIAKTSEVLSILRALRYSPTLLDTYLTCPLQFYYRAVLNLREPETLAQEPDSKEIGRLVHRILQRYFKPLCGRPLQEADLDPQRLREIVEACFAEAYGDQRSADLQLLQERVQHWGEALLAYQRQQLREASPVIIQALEKKLQGTWQGVQLEGFADRIERRGDRLVVLDYKTGQPPALQLDVLDPTDRKTWARAIGSFQLPLYRLLVAQQDGLDVDRVEAAYVAYQNGTIGETSLRVEAPAQWEAVLQVLRLVLEEIQAPDIPFAPTDALEQACPHCPYRTCCGTQWVSA
ncbi:PD-(D/E)XK nuclease family protein [Rhodothermus profundi]|uniref:PD-(D/E)XK nuclease superfamily protein n=1 Tax=Rhodothermus profundi TaxID=633813 RepID=A0A1M6T0C0_9BACT|nr:PD-(D/E)XK nuclease family protein [Rhodothermus profundi]SHK50423.1 PD-(D/E)XK nuclease superfamily protein [Rhodothermus profundi]